MYRRIYALEHLFHRRRNLSKLLAVGVQAPEFTLANQDNKPVSLSDFRGTHNVVIFFYPRAMTPGCTKQACGVRDTRDSFQSLDTVVLGISNDPPDKLKEFQNKHNLNFDLLVRHRPDRLGQIWDLVAPQVRESQPAFNIYNRQVRQSRLCNSGRQSRHPR